MKSEYPLAIRLFGSLQVEVRGELVPVAGVRKAMWLLAVLALRQGKEVDRKWLASLLWPDSSEELALYNVRRYLSQLRDRLGPESDRIKSPSPRSLALNLDGVFVDVFAFDESLKRNDPEAALALYRGPLLEQCPEEWAIAERDAREQAFAAALQQAAHQKQEAGDNAGAARLFRSALRVEPLSETAAQGLLKSLWAAADYSGGVLAFREFRLRLREELNAEPSAETAALYQAIRAAAARRTEPAELPRPRTAERKLPAPHSSIIGRDEEIESIRDSLQRHQPACRLMTLTGPGGVGKTRLALAAAEAVIEDLDAVWFVELSAAADGAQAARSVAAALEIPETTALGSTESIAERIGGRFALLVLDNCEHIIESCARLAAALLKACPRLRVLATSRQPLGVAAESIHDVSPLSLPDIDQSLSPKSLLKHVVESDAVKLFVQRAQSAHRAFALTERNARAAAELCCRLDGMPLAIELAASRARGLSAEQIVERLDRLLDFLRAADPSLAPRQQTLRASIDWSYGLLTTAEQRVLRELSVFAGGFTLEAAADVCAEEFGVDTIEDSLLQLVNKSLVIYQEPAGLPRYRLLEIVREFAREKLELTEDASAVRHRHRQYFCRFAQEREPLLHGPRQREAMEQLDLEIDNLRSALLWSIQAPAADEDALTLAGSLGRYWANRGHFSEGWEFVQPLLNRTEPIRTVSRVRALAAAGMMRVRLGDFEGSRRFHEASLELARDLGDATGIWSALMRLGQAAYAMLDFDRARELYEKALTAAVQTNDRYGMGAVHDLYGIVLRHAGEYLEAEWHFKESLALFREVGNSRGIADALFGLGMVAHNRADQDRASDLLNESLAMHHDTGVKIGIYLALTGLAASESARGRHVPAAELFGSASALRESIHLTLPTPSERENARAESAIHAALGDTAFKDAFNRGRQTPTDAFIG